MSDPVPLRLHQISIHFFTPHDTSVKRWLSTEGEHSLKSVNVAPRLRGFHTEIIHSTGDNALGGGKTEISSDAIGLSNTQGSHQADKEEQRQRQI